MHFGPPLARCVESAWDDHHEPCSRCSSAHGSGKLSLEIEEPSSLSFHGVVLPVFVEYLVGLCMGFRSAFLVLSFRGAVACQV